MRTNEGCRENNKGRLAHTDRHAAEQQAPEAPAGAACGHGGGPDGEAEAHEVEGLLRFGEGRKDRAGSDEADHERRWETPVLEVCQLEVALDAGTGGSLFLQRRDMTQ